MGVAKVILNGTTLIDTTGKTVQADKMVASYTALDKAGESITGSIATKTSSDLTANNLTVTAPSGYYASSASKTLSDANLVAENIKDGTTIFGVTGSYTGGGGSSYTLLASQDVTISTTSTSAVEEASITVTGISTIRDNGAKIIYVSIFDKAGMRTSYYYGGNYWMTKVTSMVGNGYYVKSNGTMDYTGTSYGIYPSVSGSVVKIYSRYVSSFGTLDGTFAVRIFTLDYPNDESPFV